MSLMIFYEWLLCLVIFVKTYRILVWHCCVVHVVLQTVKKFLSVAPNEGIGADLLVPTVQACFIVTDDQLF